MPGAGRPERRLAPGQSVGRMVQDVGCRVLGVGCRVKGVGRRVQGAGTRPCPYRDRKMIYDNRRGVIYSLGPRLLDPAWRRDRRALLPEGHYAAEI